MTSIIKKAQRILVETLGDGPPGHAEISLKEKGYRCFEGSINTKMPEVIKYGKGPLSSSEIMKLRLDTANSAMDDLYPLWLFYYPLSTADACIYSPDGRMKIDKISKKLQTINCQKPVRKRSLFDIIFGNRNKLAGAFILSQREYESNPGREFSKAEKAKYSGYWQTAQMAIENPFLLTLAGDDKHLLKEYVNWVFKIWQHPKEGMDIGVDNDYIDMPNLRPWRLGSIRNYKQREIEYPSFGADAQSPTVYFTIHGLGDGPSGDKADWCRFVGRNC